MKSRQGTACGAAWRVGGLAPPARNRFQLALLVAVPVFAIDQGSKLVAAAVRPDNYVLNTTSISIWWDLAVVAVAAGVLLVPFRPLAIAVGVWVGGAAGNVLDAHVWPGGVPDFIRFGGLRGTFNLADVFIAAGAAAVGTLLLVWVAVSASAHARTHIAERGES